MTTADAAEASRSPFPVMAVAVENAA